MSQNEMIADLASHSSESSHAVVIGGSIAGLLAARVLADHFDKVTIVERDAFPKNQNLAGVFLSLPKFMFC